MQIEVKIDSAYAEPKVVIWAASMTDEVNDLLNKLSEQAPRILSGSKDGNWISLINTANNFNILIIRQRPKRRAIHTGNLEILDADGSPFR